MYSAGRGFVAPPHNKPAKLILLQSTALFLDRQRREDNEPFVNAPPSPKQSGPPRPLASPCSVSASKTQLDPNRPRTGRLSPNLTYQGRDRTQSGGTGGRDGVPKTIPSRSKRLFSKPAAKAAVKAVLAGEVEDRRERLLGEERAPVPGRGEPAVYARPTVVAGAVPPVLKKQTRAEI